MEERSLAKREDGGSSPSHPTLVSTEQLQQCIETLQLISENVSAYSDQHRLKSLVEKIHRQGRKLARRQQAVEDRHHDRELQAQCGVVTHGPPARSAKQLRRPRPCYICKAPFLERHPFYHLLCPQCAQVNYAKRDQRADLQGRWALVTGGRVKIGHETALRLLRDGASVVVTTRFSEDADRRFRSHPDFAVWSHRLSIKELDFRHLLRLESQIQEWLDELPYLDILINNAAQTIRRPSEFYQHLLALPESSLKLPVHEHFPIGQLDRHGTQVDLRPQNSWRLKLDDVSPLEMAEVQVINVMAPFMLCSRLKPLFVRSPHPQRFIVNVSAMEGQFARERKSIFHPHTNMAKAALNMLTRTSAADYQAAGIFMNSVDTGWVTNENPHPQVEGMKARDGFHTPLDEIDGMARIYDPIATVLAGEQPIYGHFLKDYKSHAW